MDLSITIVSWNVRDRLRACLAAIPASVRDPAFAYEVCVVDNASADGSADMVRAEFPSVRCIASAENLGFARANNLGIHGTTGEFILLLNPDTVVHPGALEALVAFLRLERNRRVGIASGRLVDATGATIPHVRRFPTLTDQLAILVKLPHVLPRVLDQYRAAGFDNAREGRVDSVRGSFFCIRRALLDAIGGLDERFFVWFEEVDFCRRARAAGWEVAYTPTATCTDHIGQSFAQLPTYAKQRMFTKAMLQYFRKHRPTWEWAVLAAVRPWVLAAAWAHDRFVRS